MQISIPTGSAAGCCLRHFQWALFGLTLECIGIHGRPQITSRVRGYHRINKFCGPLWWRPLTDRLEKCCQERSQSPQTIQKNCSLHGQKINTAVKCCIMISHVCTQAHVLTSHLIKWHFLRLISVCCSVKQCLVKIVKKQKVWAYVHM